MVHTGIFTFQRLVQSAASFLLLKILEPQRKPDKPYYKSMGSIMTCSKILCIITIMASIDNVYRALKSAIIEKD